MQTETIKQITAAITAATSFALVLRGWHHRRRYRRAARAARMRVYGKRRGSLQQGHERSSLDSAKPVRVPDPGQERTALTKPVSIC